MWRCACHHCQPSLVCTPFSTAHGNVQVYYGIHVSRLSHCDIPCILWKCGSLQMLKTFVGSGQGAHHYTLYRKAASTALLSHIRQETQHTHDAPCTPYISTVLTALCWAAPKADTNHFCMHAIVHKHHLLGRLAPAVYKQQAGATCNNGQQWSKIYQPGHRAKNVTSLQASLEVVGVYLHPSAGACP
jgi:hypothetical protein